MEGENSNSGPILDSLTGMSRATKLFIRVDKEGFLIDSLAISDVVNFDCIESIVTSAKRIISLFTDVTAEEVDITSLFYYKKRARSLRMNPVPLVTTTDGFRAIAEHPSGEIPLGIEWVEKSPKTTPSVLKSKAKNHVEKRPRSVSPAARRTETDVPEKKRKLDIPAKYKTYMPTTEAVGSSSTDSTTLTSVAEPTKHIASHLQEEVVQSPKEQSNLVKALTENNLPDFKRIQKPAKSTDSGASEDSGKRHPRHIKSNYHWTKDVSCEVILTYDGISERRKLKPAVSAVVQSLMKGNYSVLRPDLHQNLSIIENRQTNQEILNSLSYREDDNTTITYLNDAKTEIFKVLSLLCMSKARFKDLLDWLKTLRIEEGNQGKYYLSERNVIGSGLRVMYDSDEQTAARLNSIHRARSKAKEKTKVLYPVTPLQSAVKVGKPGDYMIVVPSTSTSTTSASTNTKSAANSKPGDPVYSKLGQPLVPLTMVQNPPAQPHPAWSKEVFNKSSEPKTSLVSLLNSTSKSVMASSTSASTSASASASTSTQTFKPSSRHPNILRSKSNFHSHKLIPPSGDPVPMHLYRSYKAGKDPENMALEHLVTADKDDSELTMPVIIKQEPVDYNGDGNGLDEQSSIDTPDDCNDGSSDLNFGLVIKTEPLDDYGT